MQANPFREFPESVTVGGIEYPINSDFRVGIAIETEVLSGEKPDVPGLLSLFYCGSIPENLDEAVDRMVEFYACDSGSAQRNGNTKGGRQYDFDMDADVLLASFLSAYGVDLTAEKMHWWTFRRLMLNLPADSPFMERVRYRVADTKKMTGEERKHYKKMQRLYAIKKNKAGGMTVEERDAALLEKVRRLQEAQAKHEESQ